MQNVECKIYKKSDPKAAYFRDVYGLFLCSILAIAIHQVAVVRNMIAE